MLAPKISIIIPTLNEATNIAALITYLQKNGGESLQEIIVADAKSDDNTAELAAEAGAKIVNAERGRAVQMNTAAAFATGKILYFVHADTTPPPNFVTQILAAYAQNKEAGCFRANLKSNHFLLKINSFCTRFPFMWCRGGDQTLFITKQLFDELNGFDTQYRIMEEYDFIRRLKAKTCFYILKENVLVSTRKYEENGYFRVQIANLLVFNMFRLGFSQESMIKTYKKILNTNGLSWKHS